MNCFIFINLQSDHAWNTVTMSQLEAETDWHQLKDIGKFGPAIL